MPTIEFKTMRFRSGMNLTVRNGRKWADAHRATFSRCSRPALLSGKQVRLFPGCCESNGPETRFGEAAAD